MSKMALARMNYQRSVVFHGQLCWASDILVVVAKRQQFLHLIFQYFKFSDSVFDVLKVLLQNSGSHFAAFGCIYRCTEHLLHFI